MTRTRWKPRKIHLPDGTLHVPVSAYDFGLDTYVAKDHTRYYQIWGRRESTPGFQAERMRTLGPYGYRMNIVQVDVWGLIYESEIQRSPNGSWESLNRKRCGRDCIATFRQEIAGGHLVKVVA